MRTGLFSEHALMDGYELVLCYDNAQDIGPDDLMEESFLRNKDDCPPKAK